MKKLISIIMVAACTLSLTACGGGEIEASSKPFPKFEGTDFAGNAINNDVFKDYDVTVVNFWSNGCGSCIEEMPELEEYFQGFKDKKINLLGVAVSAGESDELKKEADEILKGKSVTYRNIIPDIESDFFKNFIGDITGYPITYLIDSEGNMIGAPLIGVVKKQEDTMMKRIDEIVK